MPAKQPKRSRFWLEDGSRTRLRRERFNHFQLHDVLEDGTHDGRKYRMLNVVDEFTRECLAIRIDRRLKSADGTDDLVELFILRAVPESIRPNNGAWFIAKAVQDCVPAVGAKTAFMPRGSPWENGFVERFNCRSMDLI